ncbi:MAG: hypothetical protein AUI01_02880 [Ktedonobacter sp. 13_2_20CM_2_56_8]|nr:MAG: hypothetical protein AUI01_02880 [Ktedonobacter sp. 13_2_20CM_2_56_8]
MYHPHHHRSPSFFSRSRLALSLCSLLLVLVLAACSLGGGSTGTAPTTTSGNTPATSHPTSVPAQPTSASAADLATYTGDGFSISYPQGWTVQKGTNGSVTFIDEHAGATKGSHVAITLGKQGLVHPTSTTLNFWQQAFMAQPNYELVVMADNHPATSPTARSWQIQYSTYTNDFAHMNANLFQPMLQSFTFA